MGRLRRFHNFGAAECGSRAGAGQYAKVLT